MKVEIPRQIGRGSMYGRGNKHVSRPNNLEQIWKLKLEMTVA